MVEGELAKQLRSGVKVRRLGAVTLAVLGAAVVLLPATGGVSFALAAPIAVLTGLEVTTIIRVTFVVACYSQGLQVYRS